MTPLDFLLAGCVVILAVLNLTTPHKCKHPCAECAYERIERARLAMEQADKNAAQSHDLGTDKAWCSICRGVHCPHEGCHRV